MTEHELISEIVRAVTEEPLIKQLREWATAPRYPEIAGVIQSVMSVPFQVIKADSRKRWHVYARMIYAYYSRARGANVVEIGKDTNHDSSTICYYLRRYAQEIKYNREFRTAVEKVEQRLNPQHPQE